MSLHPARPSYPATGVSPTRGGRAATDQRGSVLIFVIGVLMLLAIVTTAFLGSSRSDRVAAQQNGFNTQIDLLLEGVVNTMKGAVLKDARFNAAADLYDSAIDDKFLASRVPVPTDPAQTNVSAAVPPMWTYITAPPSGANFSYPMLPSTIGSPPATYTSRSNLVPTSINYKGQALPAFYLNSTAEARGYPDGEYAKSTVAVPAVDADGDGIADSGMVKLPFGPIAGITYYYGARVVDLGSAVNVNTAYAWNDGSAFGQTPGNFSPSNIDLTSMLAGTVAERKAQMENPASSANPGLNSIRFGQTDPTTDTTSATSNVQIFPVQDSQLPRGDYTFATPCELLWDQLGRRLDNPGYALETSTNTIHRMQKLDINSTVALARDYVLKDSSVPSRVESALNVSLLGNNSTVVVNDRPYNANDTLKWFNQNFAFIPGSLGVQSMPLRSLLTGTSPVGRDTVEPVVNALPPAGVPIADPTQLGQNLHFGDVLPVTVDRQHVRKFICYNELNSPYLPDPRLLPPDTYMPDQPHGLGYWGLLTGSDRTQKIDVNTADFGEIYWGFRRLLSSDGGTSVYAARSPFPIADPMSRWSMMATELAKWRMYRSTIRDPRALDPSVVGPRTIPSTNLPGSGGRYLTPSEMLQVRCALAAVNTLDIRDSDDDVTARRVRTCEYNAPGLRAPVPLHDVTVFGTEHQPYITEVVADNDSSGANPNPKGYVAVELYNPYDVDLNLNGWQLGVINRNMQTAPGGDPRVPPVNPATYPLHIDPFTPGVPAPAAPGLDRRCVIRAHSYLVLENFDASGTAATVGPNDAKHRPATAAYVTTANAYYKYVPNLHQVLYDATAGNVPGTPNGGELVLLRPRKDDLANGLPTFSQQPNDTADPCDEGTAAAPNLGDLVPIDSFDFSNMYVAPAAGPFLLWHYARESDASGATWKWTQGRRYVVTPGTASGTNQTTPRQGVSSPSFMPGHSEPGFIPPAILGAANDQGVPTTDPHIGVQINARDWPGPRPTNGQSNTFPAGAFTRPTDLFQIPTIGGYKILTLAPNIGASSFFTADGLSVNVAATADSASLLGAAAFTEMNALPMDESFADDDDGSLPPPDPGEDDSIEQVGRCCPLSTLEPIAFRNYAYDQYGSGRSASTDWYDPNFNFAENAPAVIGRRSMFDIFTVDNRNNALPNVGPEEYASTYRGRFAAPLPPENPGAMPAASSPADPDKAPGLTYVVAGPGSGSGRLTGQTNLNGAKADYYAGCLAQVLTGPSRGHMVGVYASSTGNPPTLALGPGITTSVAGEVIRIIGPGVQAADQGLININTAPWYVLARLPMAYRGNQVDSNRTVDLARQIVLYRDGNPAVAGTSDAAIFQRTPHGPFKSLMDLNRILDATGTNALFQTAGNSLDPRSQSPGSYPGDITPLNAPASAPGDFEDRYVALSRIANMVTTKSDGFVIYVNLQGWRDAGTANARLVVQRRAALIVDRSGTTKTDQRLNVTPVPSD